MNDASKRASSLQSPEGNRQQPDRTRRTLQPSESPSVLKCAEPPPIRRLVPTTPPPPLRKLSPPLAQEPKSEPSEAGISNITVARPTTQQTDSSSETAFELIQKSYRDLSTAAVELNTVSDELTKAINVWERAIQKLNLGVSAWVETSRGGTYGMWWDRSLGYAKLKDGWKIALRRRDGHENHPDEEVEEIWPFDSSPRWMRLESIGKLPELLEALRRNAEDTTKRLVAKAAQAHELAQAITIIAKEISEPRRG